MTVQYVEIAGQKLALIPVADYERLVDFAEGRSEILSAEAAERRRGDGEEYIPADIVDRLIAGEAPLKVWRTYRGYSTKSLAIEVGVVQSHISQLENGARQGKPALWKKIAGTLRVSVEDLLPDL